MTTLQPTSTYVNEAVARAQSEPLDDIKKLIAL